MASWQVYAEPQFLYEAPRPRMKALCFEVSKQGDFTTSDRMAQRVAVFFSSSHGSFLGVTGVHWKTTGRSHFQRELYWPGIKMNHLPFLKWSSKFPSKLRVNTKLSITPLGQPIFLECLPPYNQYPLVSSSMAGKSLEILRSSWEIHVQMDDAPMSSSIAEG